MSFPNSPDTDQYKKASLLALADELLLMILDGLPLKALKAFALTCDAMNKVASSLLYETVKLRLYSPDLTKLNKFVRLVCTLSLSKRDLGPNVKYMKLNFHSARNTDILAGQRVPEEDLKQILSKEFADGLEGLVLDVPDFVEKLSRGLPLAYYRLLLLSCSNIRGISIKTNHPIDDIWYFNLSLSQNQERYKHIEQLNWYFDGDFDERANANDRMLSRLGQLQSLSTLKIVLNVQWESFGSSRFPLGHLRHLDLMACEAPLKSLQNLLTSTPKLICLRLDLVENFMSPKVDSPEGLCHIFAQTPKHVTPTDPIYAEKAWQASLQSLAIQVRPRRSTSRKQPHPPNWPGFGRGIGSLKHFSSLTYLEATSGLLYGNDLQAPPILNRAFPDSLKCLWLDRCEFLIEMRSAGDPLQYCDIAITMKHYAERQTRLPNLKRLGLDPEIYYRVDIKEYHRYHGILSSSLQQCGMELVDHIRNQWWDRPDLFQTFEKGKNLPFSFNWAQPH
ncbi:uncharacterized protein K452DRAFT_309046 [Aplosporella prunicola CBS 121167]|uniref:F-box domain-containing protein n=1 Tax=Aplosporella prunicola CBS 121167 TaxID=1176127 RepID=A0A6A6BAL7_9PEZI|nr:uncharacterized protein K452DRAFT_309046 [Aplosporella prunicola CBS 121167]KAF2141259.1 hypothetical protein K452DRAFT_309046 [Aplosporella prunicola CBS 121167]